MPKQYRTCNTIITQTLFMMWCVTSVKVRVSIANGWFVKKRSDGSRGITLQKKKSGESIDLRTIGRFPVSYQSTSMFILLGSDDSMDEMLATLLLFFDSRDMVINTITTQMVLTFGLPKMSSEELIAKLNSAEVVYSFTNASKSVSFAWGKHNFLFYEGTKNPNQSTLRVTVSGDIDPNIEFADLIELLISDWSVLDILNSVMETQPDDSSNDTDDSSNDPVMNLLEDALQWSFAPNPNLIDLESRLKQELKKVSTDLTTEFFASV